MFGLGLALGSLVFGRFRYFSAIITTLKANLFRIRTGYRSAEIDPLKIYYR